MARQYFRAELMRLSEPQLAERVRGLPLLDPEFGVFLLIVAVIFALIAAWVGWRFSSYIGRILLKAEEVLARRSAAAGAPRSSSSETVFGELSDLESSLDTIGRDLQDKTESLRLEREELSTLMGSITDAILAIDQDGVPLFFNSRFALLFGDETSLRRRTVRLWEMFREPEVLESFREALKSGKNAVTKAMPIGKGDATKRFFSLSVSPLKRPTGQIYGAVGIFHDVTELKSAEQIRIDFVANVSHELRTPLTSIKGYTDTLIEDIQSGRQVSREFLDIIARNVERLMALIGDLLDLSALESTDVLQKTQVPVEELTSRVARQLQGAIVAKNQVLDIEVGVPVVTADPKRVEQVLVNLLDNANKYTPIGGKIFVRWDGNSHDVTLRVKDNGPGIPPEHHGRLFERFYRVDKARSREQGGTGLGLAIVKHIMQRHGGEVWVESKMGAGSSFVCRFPN
jgi:two-component system phosphate regulon sensor histidine kinase PhoR